MKPGESPLTVTLRVRPLNPDEILVGATNITAVVEDRMVVLQDPIDDSDDVLRANRSREKQYVFDTAFHGSSTQEEVYQKTTKNLIPGVISGFNATVFAYGATGCGKTYTMLGTSADPGIMARTLNDLFHEMKETSSDMTYRVTMSYLEIYNEMIRDLLNPATGYLDLREDEKGRIQVAALSSVSIRNTDEVMDLLVMSNRNRTTEPTAANKTSSRSHAVLQVTVQQRGRTRGTVQEVRTGTLHLIDLAGSERASVTQNRGKRMVEGAHINRSLLALGNCINALSEGKGGYINYRDSKLTRLLKDSLGGNCKTVMIAHVSPASIHFEESRNTLVYADRAKQIKNNIRRNLNDVSYHVAQYTMIITELRHEIVRLKQKLDQQAAERNTASAATLRKDGESEEERMEMSRLKRELQIAFEEQLALKHSLLDMNNQLMAFELESSRSELVLQDWESKRERRARRNESSMSNITQQDSKSQLSLVDTTVSPTSLTGGNVLSAWSEPESVRVAREELSFLQTERSRLQRQRVSLESELQSAQEKITLIEKNAVRWSSNTQQREAFQLLSKVHALEIENAELQGTLLLRAYDMRRRDLLLARLYEHRGLADEIIQHQRRLLNEHSVAVGMEVEELMEAYNKESERIPVLPVIDHTPLTAAAGVNLTRERSSTSQLRQISSLAKSMSVADSDVTGGVGGTLFHRSARWLPSVQPMDRKPSLVSVSSGEAGEVSVQTRNIAAKAASRRLQRKYNTERAGSKQASPDGAYLSASRLAQHDHIHLPLTSPLPTDVTTDAIAASEPRPEADSPRRRVRGTRSRNNQRRNTYRLEVPSQLSRSTLKRGPERDVNSIGHTGQRLSSKSLISQKPHIPPPSQLPQPPSLQQISPRLQTNQKRVLGETVRPSKVPTRATRAQVNGKVNSRRSKPKRAGAIPLTTGAATGAIPLTTGAAEFGVTGQSVHK